MLAWTCWPGLEDSFVWLLDGIQQGGRQTMCLRVYWHHFGICCSESNKARAGLDCSDDVLTFGIGDVYLWSSHVLNTFGLSCSIFQI